MEGVLINESRYNKWYGIYSKFVTGSYASLEELYNESVRIYNCQFYKVDFDKSPMPNKMDTEYLLKNKLVPIGYDFNSHIQLVGILPEDIESFKYNAALTRASSPMRVKTITMFDWVRAFSKAFDKLPEFLADLPAKDYWEAVIKEGDSLKASDMTIRSKVNGDVEVYFKVNKRKVYSKTFYRCNMKNLVNYLYSISNRTKSDASKNKVVFFSLLYDKYRLRTVINYTIFGGYAITVRLSNMDLHRETFNSLSIPENIQKEWYDNIINKNLGGLDIVAGPTESGKNTTLITMLNELNKTVDAKIVSVENPVEIISDFMVQIDTDTEDEFKDSVSSLIRQNPDVVYITEMSHITTLPTLEISNTGKKVFSTVHSNSCADTITRIIDLSGYQVNDILRIVNTITHQKLLPKKCNKCNDKGCPECYKAGMVPVISFLKITEDIRKQCLNKSTQEIYEVLDKHTINKSHLDDLLKGGIISETTYFKERGEINEHR